MAAVRVVLPWSMWPMVPTFTCGLVRANCCLAMVPPRVCWSSQGERGAGAEHRVPASAGGRFLAGPDTPAGPHVRPDRWPNRVACLRNAVGGVVGRCGASGGRLLVGQDSNPAGKLPGRI